MRKDSAYAGSEVVRSQTRIAPESFWRRHVVCLACLFLLSLHHGFHVARLAISSTAGSFFEPLLWNLMRHREGTIASNKKTGAEAAPVSIEK
jgi:hypothetical protein